MAALATVALWLIPGGQYIALPLQYLNTHLHEMSHALAAVLTGGSVDNIHVYADGSGVTLAAITIPTIVGSAGYVGASLIGAAVIALSRDSKTARYALVSLAAILLIEDVFWLRGDAVGMISGFAYLVIFTVLGLKLDGWAAILTAQFVGLQQCLTSLQAVFVLFNFRVLAFRDNDATILQNQTGVPAVIWSFGWALLSVCLMVLALSSAWRKPRPRHVPAGVP